MSQANTLDTTAWGPPLISFSIQHSLSINLVSTEICCKWNKVHSEEATPTGKHLNLISLTIFFSYHQI